MLFFKCVFIFFLKKFCRILAENEANSLISKADNNNDGKLTSGEILEKYSLFISPESDGYYIFKDEL